METPTSIICLIIRKAAMVGQGVLLLRCMLSVFVSALLSSTYALPTTQVTLPAPYATSASTFQTHPYPAHLPPLHFPSDSFKLLIVTDTHLLDDQTVPGNASNVAKASVEAIRELLAMEKPDFVVHLGDLISGEAANNTQDVEQAIKQVLQPMIEARIPFATTKGNHDNDQYSTHRRITELEHKFAKTLSYTRVAPPSVGGGDVGSDNYWVPIFGGGGGGAHDVHHRHTRRRRPKLLLWFFDSRSGRTFDTTQPVDAWVDESVAGWIEEETKQMRRAWGNALPPAIVFVHIPVEQHLLAQQDTERVGGVLDESSTNFTSFNFPFPGLNDDVPVDVQQRGRDGAFLHAFLTSQRQSHTHAIVSGHDHGADWCAPGRFDNPTTTTVPVCFAKHTGYGGYDYDNWNHGARVFVFNGSNIDSGAETYIRFQTGEQRYTTTLTQAWSTQ